jgi:hypothetical protein
MLDPFFCRFAEGELPLYWADYKRLATSYFPGGIYDTKLISRSINPQVFDSSALGDLFETFTLQAQYQQQQQQGQGKWESVGNGVHVNGNTAAPTPAPLAVPSPQQQVLRGFVNGGVGGDGGALNSSQQGNGTVAASLSQRELNSLLEAGRAGHEGGVLFELPRVEHAPGFEKYKGLEPGAAAHEAGYDAFMTGSCFAMLLTVKQAAEAAAAASSAAAAGNALGVDMQLGAAAVGDELRGDAAAAAAAAANGSGPEMQPGAAVLGEESQGDATAAAELTGTGSEDGGAATEMRSAAAGAVAVAAGDVLAPVQEFRGRLNLGKSDILYAALEGGDPVPDRSHVFHVGGLVGTWGPGLVVKILQGAGAEQVGEGRGPV